MILISIILTPLRIKTNGIFRYILLYCIVISIVKWLCITLSFYNNDDDAGWFVAIMTMYDNLTWQWYSTSVLSPDMSPI